MVLNIPAGLELNDTKHLVALTVRAWDMGVNFRLFSGSPHPICSTAPKCQVRTALTSLVAMMSPTHIVIILCALSTSTVCFQRCSVWIAHMPCRLVASYEKTVSGITRRVAATDFERVCFFTDMPSPMLGDLQTKE